MYSINSLQYPLVLTLLFVFLPKYGTVPPNTLDFVVHAGGDLRGLVTRVVLAVVITVVVHCLLPLWLMRSSALLLLHREPLSCDVLQVFGRLGPGGGGRGEGR